MSIVFLFFFIIYQFIEYKKFTHINNLKRSYDDIEMYFIKNEIILKKDYIELLKIFKNLSVNPSYLDIKILLLSKIILEKKGSLSKDKLWFDRTLKSLPSDFIVLFDKFDKSSNELIRLSFFKYDFIYFILKIFISNLLTSRINSFKSLASDFKFITNNEEVIAYGGMRINLC